MQMCSSLPLRNSQSQREHHVQGAIPYEMERHGELTSTAGMVAGAAQVVAVVVDLGLVGGEE